MGNYISSRVSPKGEFGISKDVFKTIGLEVLKEFDGIIEKDEKLEKSKPTLTIVLRRNKVFFKYILLLDEKTSKEIIENEITNAVSNSLLTICDAIPFEISFSYISNKKKK